MPSWRAWALRRGEETCVMVCHQKSLAALRGHLPPGPLASNLSVPVSGRDGGSSFEGQRWLGREAHAERLQGVAGAFFCVCRARSQWRRGLACGQYGSRSRTRRPLRRVHVTGKLVRSGSRPPSASICWRSRQRTAWGNRIPSGRRLPNIAARRIYERLGFEVAYTYHYRIRPSHAAGIASRGGRRPG